jgi:putative hemolysin
MNLLAAAATGADLLLIAAILVLLGVLMFLAVAEMGLSRMTKPKAAALADKGHKSGRSLVRLVSEPERWINPVLLSVNATQTVQATLTGLLFKRLFDGAWWGIALGVIINIVVFYVMAEALPKTYAVLYPDRAALVSARPTAALVAFPPLRLISGGLISLTNVVMPGKGLEKGPFVSEQEFLGIVEAAAEDDVIEDEERELIESIIEFGDTVAREVMVPRPDIIMVDSDQTITQALDIAIEHGFSRLPVVHDDDGDDDVVGLAFTKDLIAAERSGRGGELIGVVARPVRFIPENKPVARLMREMQADKFHLAIVADEYGAIAGLITLEDCLEELVGEIVDEYDNEETEIRKLDNGDYLVEGSTSISDLNGRLAMNLPDENWDTVGGFVFSTLGHVPVPGEEVDFDGWTFTVEEIDGRRIRMLRVAVGQTVDDEAIPSKGVP